MTQTRGMVLLLFVPECHRPDRYLKANESLSERQILHLFLKIAGAVSFAHRNLIVHRDLKPANILDASLK